MSSWVQSEAQPSRNPCTPSQSVGTPLQLLPHGKRSASSSHPLATYASICALVAESHSLRSHAPMNSHVGSAVRPSKHDAMHSGVPSSSSSSSSSSPSSHCENTSKMAAAFASPKVASHPMC